MPATAQSPGDGLIALPTAAGVEAVAIPISGPDGRLLPSGRIAVDSRSKASAQQAAPGFSATVTVPDGQMIGVEWENDPTGAVQVRARSEGTWGGWVDLAPDASDGPDPGSPENRGSAHTAVGPVWTGSGTDAVQVRVTAGRLTDLRLDVLRTDTAGAPDLSKTTTSGDGRALSSFGIYPRSTWGAGPWRSSTPGCDSAPEQAPIRHAVVHHTASGNDYSRSEVDDALRGFYYYHTQNLGWCDIAYNFLVDRFGGTWEGRTGSLTSPVVGGHAKGFNTGSVGISMIGNYDVTPVPEATVQSLSRVLAWRLGTAGVDPAATVQVVSAGSNRFSAGTTVTLPTINSHNQTGLTACPGGYGIGRMSAIRMITKDLVNRSTATTVPSEWEPEPGKPAVQVLDGFGGIHPAGRASRVRGSAHWPDWKLARGIAGNAGGGYVLDAWGGVHSYGSAPAASGSAYWRGKDMAVSISRGPRSGSGYVLDAFGGIHPFGRANSAAKSPARWPGWRIARDITSTSGGNGGYVLDAFGAVHAFGGAPAFRASGYWPGKDLARAVALRPDGPGGWVLDAYGNLHPFGGAPRVQPSHVTPGVTGHVDLVVLAGNRGYVLDKAGRTWNFGWAPPLSHSMAWPEKDLSAGLVISG